MPQLGLSASVVKERSPDKDDGGASEDPHVPRTKLSEVGGGDRITVTTTDGSSRVYKITGSRVVDPHMAQTEPGPSGDDPTLVTCLPLDPLLASSLRLVIQATTIDPPAAPDPRPEQKL